MLRRPCRLAIHRTALRAARRRSPSSSSPAARRVVASPSTCVRRLRRFPARRVDAGRERARPPVPPPAHPSLAVLLVTRRHRRTVDDPSCDDGRPRGSRPARGKVDVKSDIHLLLGVGGPVPASKWSARGWPHGQGLPPRSISYTARAAVDRARSYAAAAGAAATTHISGASGTAPAGGPGPRSINRTSSADHREGPDAGRDDRPARSPLLLLVVVFGSVVAAPAARWPSAASPSSAPSPCCR